MVMKDPEGPVRAALFDVDGTLVDTNYLHAVTWWEAFAQAGLWSRWRKSTGRSGWART